MARVDATLVGTVPYWPLTLAIFCSAFVASYRCRAQLAIPVTLVAAGLAGALVF